MEKDLGKYRMSYQKNELSIDSMSENPMEIFKDWFAEAELHGGNIEPNAMTLATVDENGMPRSRVVLLKKFTGEGFVFYTNYKSNKGQAIEKNPMVCLSFYWHKLERQIIIQGKASKLPKNISDKYFESRPDGSKLGAWASEQSMVVTSREYLEGELKKYEEKFKDAEIPRPLHWGGYLVLPEVIEFWQGRPNRLHDRIKYTLQKDFDWKIERLAP
jgi:pyridoxamine 5'-phosphate oxidase